MPQQQLKVMISSTARDLPEHRKELVEACLRQDAFPLRMEDLPANSDEAAAASIKMVEGADIYIGVFANRYGYVPKANNPTEISVTEMEYNRAVERKIERLIFIMDKSHPITVEDVEIENAVKLKAFKERVGTENIVKFFKSPADLRAEAINSLSKLRQPDLTAFHYVSDIPAPPEPFIAHPYTLLETHKLVGRQAELGALTDWVAKPESEIYGARILSIVAIGGLGKSALTWKWFNDIAPQEMKPQAGRIWWSFYESDASFENFVTRALAYVTKLRLEEVQKIPLADRETRLLTALDHQPFLIVLDGLERILIAYARMDAGHLSDDDYDRQTANHVANAYGLPASAAQSFIGEHRLRKTANPRAGAFLRRLSNVRASRILASTRLYPADLQTVTGHSLGGSAAIFLRGLSDDDALDLWRAFGVTGSRDSLLPLFNQVDNHSLVIQALASEVARYRRAPGDFDAWRRGHADFNPFSLPLVQVKSHVLEFGLRGLDDKARRVLEIISAFRMPASYSTLAALLIGKGKPCADERELDSVLTELEDRGLVGWERRANRYDLHPIVRGVVWSQVGDKKRRTVYTTLCAHFESLSRTYIEDEVKSLEELTPVIEWYSTLVNLGRYDEAISIFSNHLYHQLLLHLNASRQLIELLGMLSPKGNWDLSLITKLTDRSVVLLALGLGHEFAGEPERAADFFSLEITASQEEGDQKGAAIGLGNLAEVLGQSGKLHRGEAESKSALLIAREMSDKEQEGIVLMRLGSLGSVRAKRSDCERLLARARRILKDSSARRYLPDADIYQAQLRLWEGDFSGAFKAAEYPTGLTNQNRFWHYLAQAARLQGTALLGLGKLAKAEEHLHQATTAARAVNFVLAELPTLISLAELRRQQTDLKAAREFLDDVWEAAERGPYPLFHADALNVLAQIERDEGNTAAAVETATKAYRLAWCDGPPFAYHWGLEKAKRHLTELGAPEPAMPPFDESEFEPMPEVEIDPDDEFHVGNVTDRELS